MRRGSVGHLYRGDVPDRGGYEREVRGNGPGRAGGECAGLLRGRDGRNSTIYIYLVIQNGENGLTRLDEDASLYQKLNQGAFYDADHE